jgi:hypothetical protein
MIVNVEQLVEWRLAGETEVVGENLLQCHFVHHEYHITLPCLEPGPRWEASDWAMARPFIWLKDKFWRMYFLLPAARGTYVQSHRVLCILWKISHTQSQYLHDTACHIQIFLHFHTNWFFVLSRLVYLASRILPSSCFPLHIQFYMYGRIMTSFQCFRQTVLMFHLRHYTLNWF